MDLLKRHQPSKKCECCPYGFHIDLDFVEFAENIASGGGAATATVKSQNEKNDLRLSNRKSAQELREQRIKLNQAETLLSDSLENIVSDLESSFRPRSYNSDRDFYSRKSNSANAFTKKPTKNTCNSGYFSDYGSNRVRTANNNANRYRTALGRTFFEITSKRRDELEPERQYEYRTRMQRRNPPDDFGIASESHFENDRWSPHAGTKSTHLIGLKPSVDHSGQANFSITSPRTTFQYQYQSDSELPPTMVKSNKQQQQHQRSQSAFQRSYSGLDANNFASLVRRRTAMDQIGEQGSQHPPLPMPRRSSINKMQRLETVKKPQMQLPHFEYFTAAKNGAVKTQTESHGEPIQNCSKPDFDTTTMSTENWYDKMLVDGSLVSNRDFDDRAQCSLTSLESKACLDCDNLKQQLINLSHRLALATSQINYNKLNAQQYDQWKSLIESRSMQIQQIPSTGSVIDQTSIADRQRIDHNGRLPVSSVGCSTSPCLQYRSTGTCTISIEHCEIATDMSDNQLHQAVSDAKQQTENFGATTIDCAIGDDVVLQTADVASLTNHPMMIDRACELSQPIQHKNAHTMTTTRNGITDSRSMQTELVRMKSVAVQVLLLAPVADKASGTLNVVLIDAYTMDDRITSLVLMDAGTQVVQMEHDDHTGHDTQSAKTIALQTEFGADEPRVLNDSEIAESLWLMPAKDTSDVAVGNEEDLALPDANILFENTDDDDMIYVVEESLSDPEAIDYEKSAGQSPARQHQADDSSQERQWTRPEGKSRPLGEARAAVVKKLLTDPSPNLSFVRGSKFSRSWRPETKKGDSLQYIADKHTLQQNGSTPSTPGAVKGALREKVMLKKDLVNEDASGVQSTSVVSKVPEPVPAKIPRPKITKYNPGETIAHSPDEEAEVADRLTPLRSEMRTLQNYSNGRVKSSTVSKIPVATYRTAPVIVDDNSSSSSSDSEGSYDTNEANSSSQFELTPQLSQAISVLTQSFERNRTVDSASLDWALKFAKHEWLKTAARKTASASQVQGFIETLKGHPESVFKLVINMSDPNENTALHYAVSHGNFSVVSALLDSRVCDLNRSNKAGYTAVMLAALCDAVDEFEYAVIHRLFQLGNVNAQAVQHGQTALMLAVSHGKIKTTQLLIDCKADLNIQDEEGSTALMCAAEHGHKAIVKLLLDQISIDASLSDCDSSTALSIAVENGHRDIGVLIYAHLNHPNKQSTINHDIDNSTKSISNNNQFNGSNITNGDGYGSCCNTDGQTTNDPNPVATSSAQKLMTQ